MKLSTALFSAVIALPGAHAWGSLGHETVAYVASSFVSPATKAHFQAILHNETDSYLAGVATWADSFRYTAAGRFSAPFHFIDAEDHPPASCDVKYSRDCGGHGCILRAIQNYTSQLLDPNSEAGQKNMAAKFIIHFLGDIHQPLHDEGLDRGGNSISVNFTGKVTNLHHVWDTSIPEKLVGGYSLAFAEAWAKILTASILTGPYKIVASSWLEGIDLSDPISTSLAWATESNRLVCTSVLPEGVEGVRAQELDGAYYERAVPVVQMQIAKSGYRLATWLDLIAQGIKTEL